jgi:CubicO group peptidase (beta-lactamase class C family)
MLCVLAEQSGLAKNQRAAAQLSRLVGLLLADAKIKTIDDPVTNYLPELKGSGYDGVPVRDLLEMSSGVRFTEEYGKSECRDAIRGC